jgi:hypothetical protein
MDPSTFLNNPAFLQMATRVMQDPNMQQMWVLYGYKWNFHFLNIRRSH